MLTGLAILERELGLVEYERHRLTRLLAGTPSRAQAGALRRELEQLRIRREKTLDLLDEKHEEYQDRVRPW